MNPQTLRELIARNKGRASAEGAALEVPLPFAEAARKQAREDEAERARAEAERLRLSRIPGALQEDGSVYLGAWTPRDKNGSALSKAFNVFAAPYDLGGIKDYHGFAAEAAALRDWFGHDGGDAELLDGKLDEWEMIDAVGQGRAGDKWIIPPLDVVKMLVDHQDDGALRGTLRPGIYWSSSATRYASFDPVNAAYVTDTRNGNSRPLDKKQLTSAGVRLVRLEEIKGP